MLNQIPRLLFALILAAATIAQAQDADPSKRRALPAPGKSSGPTPDANQVEQAVLQATNTFREKQDLPTVTSSQQLNRAAEAFARFMAENLKYGHYADGKRPAQRAEEKGYEYCIVLENIAYAKRPQGTNVAELSKTFQGGWEKSPDHRRNLLDPDIKHIGLGVARTGDTYFAVQMFGRPATDRIAFRIANQTKELVEYQLRDQTYELPPRISRTHRLCRPSPVQFVQPARRSVQPKSNIEIVLQTAEDDPLQISTKPVELPPPKEPAKD